MTLPTSNLSQLLFLVVLVSVVAPSSQEVLCFPPDLTCDGCYRDGCFYCDFGGGVFTCGDHCPNGSKQVGGGGRPKCTGKELSGVIVDSATSAGCPLSVSRRLCALGSDIMCFETAKQCSELFPTFTEKKCENPGDKQICRMCARDMCAVCTVGLGFYCTKELPCPPMMRIGVGDAADICSRSLYRIRDAEGQNCRPSERACTDGGMEFCVDRAGGLCGRFQLSTPSCRTGMPQPATCETCAFYSCKTCFVGTGGYHCGSTCPTGSREADRCDGVHVNAATSIEGGEWCGGKRCKLDGGVWCFSRLTEGATCASLGMEDEEKDAEDVCELATPCDACQAGGCAMCKFGSLSLCKPKGTTCHEVKVSGAATTTLTDCKGILGSYLGDLVCPAGSPCMVEGKYVCVKGGCQMHSSKKSGAGHPSSPKHLPKAP